MATTPNIYNMGTVDIGGTAPKTDLKAFNQSMVNAKPVVQTPGTFTGATSNNFLNTPPTVISNANVATKVPGIVDTYNQQVNTSSNTPPLPGTTAYTTTNTPKVTPTVTDTTTQTVTLPEGAVDQGNGTVLYQGRYFAKDALSNPENIASLANYNTDKTQVDAALQSQLDAINKRYDQYKQTQQQINTSQQGQVQSALLQSEGGNRGSVAQFAAATADARVNSIMEDGQKTLQELDIKRDELLAAAKDAYRTQNYKLLDTLNAQIEKTMTEKRAAAAATSKKLAEEAQQAKIDTTIADIYAQGTTDVPSILNQLKARGISASASTVQDTIKNITPVGLDDLVKTMRQNNAPADLIQKTINTGISKGVGSAYTESGKYGAGGTGIIGEYNYYVAQAQSQGIKPVDFSTYQNQDANRKAIAIGANNLTPAQTNIFDRITTKFQADPFINNALKGQTAVSIADQVLANPESATNQLKSLYVLVKNLDPDSAVREGEISLAQQTLSYADRFKTVFDRISNGQVIAPSAAKELALATKDLAKAWTETAAKRQKQYEAQAQGSGVKDAFQQYLQNSGVGSFINTSNELLKGQAKNQQAFTKLIEGNKNDPVVSQEISNRIQDLIDTLGHEPTADEYFEAYPYDMPKELSMGTNGGGIVEGVDITSYATDPKHEQKIATIVEKAPYSNNALDYDKYIRSIAPTSSITGDMILTASSTHDVDPRLVLAIIQNDSSFGTKGHGARNNNPGNIGQFDNLKTTAKGYPTLAAGVEAVAKWLAKHKVNNIA